MKAQTHRPTKGKIWVDRNIEDAEWFKNHIIFKVAMVCLLRAHYKAERYGGIDYKPGQFSMTQRQFA